MYMNNILWPKTQSGNSFIGKIRLFDL